MRRERLLAKALASPNNLVFRELVSLTEAFGFRLVHTSGSHHIFVHPNVAEPLNLQSVGRKAKPYQVRQLLSIVESHNLTLGEDP